MRLPSEDCQTKTIRNKNELGLLSLLSPREARDLSTTQLNFLLRDLDSGQMTVAVVHCLWTVSVSMVDPGQFYAVTVVESSLVMNNKKIGAALGVVNGTLRRLL